MTITGVVICRRVDDLDAAVDFYERRTGQTANRFAFGEVDLAGIGPFLVFSAPETVAERLARVVATVSVDDVAAQAAELQRLGAEIVAPPTSTPNGRRLIARHLDGGVFEYVGP